MNPTDSLHLDEHLARLLAAYDQGIDNGESRGQTIDYKELPPNPSGDERLVEPLSGSQMNQGSFGDLLPDPPVVDPFAATPKQAPETHRIGRFELRRQLGKGGCGIVFLAYDPKLKREVALKIPRPELLMNTDARRRLLREATAAAGFDHPNLVPVYETGEIGPVCFIATVFCPGQTLSEWLDRQAFPIPIRQTARLVAQLAEAVQHAHDRSVLHRDLKPNNVILQEVRSDPNVQDAPPGACPLRGDFFIPRVVDFGLAKLTDQGPSETGTRQILGTPKYMAPEQAQGRHEDVGPEADVYALGVILYEMLSGRTPYEGATDVEVLRQSIEGNPPMPRSIRREIPRDLEAICMKAMSRTPSRRYRAAIDLADDLRRFLDGLPTLARPLNAIGRSARWLRRNDQLFALVTVSTISCVLLAIGMWNAYQTSKYQVVRNESQVRDAERVRLEGHRTYYRHLRDAFLAWQAGDSQQFADSLRDARTASVMAGDSTEFAWGYLTQLGRVERASVPCPAGKPLAIAIASNGPWMATGHESGILTIWNRETGKPAGKIEAHEQGVAHLAFVQGGSRVITASAEPRARLWSIGAKGEPNPSSTLSPLGAPVSALAASPDGMFAYLGSAKGECVCWNVIENKPVRSWAATRGAPLTALAVSRDGKTVATAGTGEPIRLWESGRELPAGEISGADGARGLAFLPGQNGWLLAAAGEDGTVRIFDRDRREVRTLVGHAAPILALGATRDGASLASSAEDDGVCIWNVATGTKRMLLRGNERPVRGVGFAPDGLTLFTVSDDGTLKTWELPADPDGPSIRGLPSAVIGLATRSEGPEYSAGYADGAVEVFAQRGNPPRRFAPQGRNAISVLRYPETGPLLGVELNGRSATVWEFGDAARVVFRTEVRGTVADLSPINGWLAVGDDRGQVTVWSIADREIKGSFSTGLDAPVRHLAFSDNGRFLAAPTVEHAIGVWFVSDPAIRYKVPEHGDGVRQLRFLGNERIIAAGRGSSIRIWNLTTNREDASLLGHVGRITNLAVSPDLRTLMSGTATGDVKLWDLRTGQELIGIRRHTGPVLAADFSGDGRLLITGGTGPAGRGELAFWDSPKE